LAVGGWRLAVGGWRLAVGGWRLAVGGWRLAVVGSCCCCWRLLAVVGGCFRLLAVVGGCWRLLAVVVVAEKSCCDADNDWSDKRTKARSSHEDLVELKVISSVELSRTEKNLVELSRT
jgi:hypothetical protein